MYKLLFAEDESATRNGILESIDWKALGIDEVRAEKNGALAYRTAETFLPDILLTDIRMPRMDGIELSKKVRELNPNCSILIISGYAEVEYLKSAIQLHAINFVDKPIELPDLEKQLEKAVLEQDKVLEKRRLLQTELASLLRYPGFSTDRVEAIVNELHHTQEPPCYQPILIRVLSTDGQPIAKSSLYGVAEKMNAMLEEQSECFCVGLHRHCIHLSLIGANWDFRATSKTLAEGLPQYRLYFFVGQQQALSEYGQNLLEVTSYLKSLFYRKNRYYIDGENVLCVREQNTIPDLQPFTKAIQERNAEEAKKFARNLLDEVHLQQSLSPFQTAEVCYRMMLKLLPTGADSMQEFSQESAVEWLEECIFLECMEQELLSEIDRRFETYGNENGKFPIDQILGFIHLHYNDRDLSLNYLSAKFYLSNAYLCVRFKELMGKTFVRYLTEYRIQQAITLLNTTGMKINDIAESVGFDNGGYFTKIFKKEMGMTPAEFRKK